MLQDPCNSCNIPHGLHAVVLQGPENVSGVRAHNSSGGDIKGRQIPKKEGILLPSPSDWNRLFKLSLHANGAENTHNRIAVSVVKSQHNTNSDGSVVTSVCALS